MENERKVPREFRIRDNVLIFSLLMFDLLAKCIETDGLNNWTERLGIEADYLEI